MTFAVQAWWTPKAGYGVSEYEDAYSVAEMRDDAPLRVAVTDGATGATFSALWASLLAADYASGLLTAETLPTRVPFLARDWAERVQSNPLPWYAQAKVTGEGSHAALLGVTVSPTTGDYQALVIGDCALFHLRPAGAGADAYRVLLSFPFTRWSDFSGTPVLIGTRPTTQANIASHTVVRTGTVQAGDVLYLMSDALGAWFLRETAEGRSPWLWLAPLDLPNGDRTLTAMVRELRDNKRLKNDDVTVVRIQVFADKG
ncbi:MAG: protein phosphatase 2C domain-containing protein [Akkermansiaceae bacterium]|nr:protein phosphatase 2C domain-containing protein [Armatimonadota bacterium]